MPDDKKLTPGQEMKARRDAFLEELSKKASEAKPVIKPVIKKDK